MLKKTLRCCIYHANNVIMRKIVGILTFIRMINFMLSDEVKKLFSCSTQLNIEFQLLIKMLKKKSFYDVFILLIVDILTFMNMISFMFS